MSNQIEVPQYDSILSLVVRIFWTLIGNAVAFFALLAIFSRKERQFSSADLIFFCTIGLVILARFIDDKFWGEKGEAAAKAQKKYALIYIIAAALLWSLAHLINAIFIDK